MQKKQAIAVGASASAENQTLLTVPELAALLRLSNGAIRAWVLHKKIPYIKLAGKSIRFRKSDVDALLQRSVVPAGLEAARLKAGS